MRSVFLLGKHLQRNNQDLARYINIGKSKSEIVLVGDKFSGTFEVQKDVCAKSELNR